MAQKKRIMSGMRPTGKLHIGHYLGVLKNWVALQDEYNCYFAVADWHALTTKYDQTEELRQNVLDVVLDWLACGIDPEKSHVYVQSLIPQTAELHIYLSMITPHKWVVGDPTLKDLEKAVKLQMELNSKAYQQVLKELKPNQIEPSGLKELNYAAELVKRDQEKKEEIKNTDEVTTYGLLGYPVLQSADIMTFNADLVPVGIDQVAHIEITRDIARRFNHIYKTDFFHEAHPKLTQIPLLKGMDGEKMGKSFGNDIKISDDEDTTTKKIMKGITDRNRMRRDDSGQVKNCEVIYPYYEIFADETTCAVVKAECESAARGCADCKRQLAELVNEYFRPIRAKRKELEQNPDYVHQIIREGSKRAAEDAQKTIDAVREIIKMY